MGVDIRTKYKVGAKLSDKYKIGDIVIYDDFRWVGIVTEFRILDYGIVIAAQGMGKHINTSAWMEGSIYCHLVKVANGDLAKALFV